MSENDTLACGHFPFSEDEGACPKCLSTLRRVVLEEAEKVDGACPCASKTPCVLGYSATTKITRACKCATKYQDGRPLKQYDCLWPGHAIAARLKRHAKGVQDA